MISIIALIVMFETCRGIYPVKLVKYKIFLFIKNRRSCNIKGSGFLDYSGGLHNEIGFIKFYSYCLMQDIQYILSVFSSSGAISSDLAKVIRTLD